MKLISWFRLYAANSNPLAGLTRYFDVLQHMDNDVVHYPKSRTSTLESVFRHNLKHSAFRPYVVFSKKRKLRLSIFCERHFLTIKFNATITSFSGLYKYLHLDKGSSFIVNMYDNVDSKQSEEFIERQGEKDD